MDFTAFLIQGHEGITTFYEGKAHQLAEEEGINLYYVNGEIFARLELTSMSTRVQMMLTGLLRHVAIHHDVLHSESYARPGVLNFYANKQEKDPEKFQTLIQDISPYHENMIALYADNYPYELTTVRDYLHKFARNYLGQE